jgi:hypothetical protein
MWRWGTYKAKCDRKKVGNEYHFRLSPRDKQISVHELIRNSPILELEFKVEQTQRRCHRDCAHYDRENPKAPRGMG